MSGEGHEPIPEPGDEAGTPATPAEASQGAGSGQSAPDATAGLAELRAEFSGALTSLRDDFTGALGDLRKGLGADIDLKLDERLKLPDELEVAPGNGEGAGALDTPPAPEPPAPPGGLAGLMRRFLGE